MVDQLHCLGRIPASNKDSRLPHVQKMRPDSHLKVYVYHVPLPKTKFIIVPACQPGALQSVRLLSSHKYFFFGSVSSIQAFSSRSRKRVDVHSMRIQELSSSFLPALQTRDPVVHADQEGCPRLQHVFLHRERGNAIVSVVRQPCASQRLLLVPG